MKRLTFQIYLIYGPIIGTSVFIYGFLLGVIWIDPLRVLLDMAKPSNLFIILFFTVLTLIFGYFIGLIPALISAKLFYKMIHKRPQYRHLNDYIFFGFLATIPWMLVAAVTTMFYPESWSITLFLSCISIISSIACAAYIWRKMVQSDQNLPPELP